MLDQFYLKKDAKKKIKKVLEYVEEMKELKILKEHQNKESR